MKFLRKLRSTLRIAATLILARTFGRYEHSIYEHSFYGHGGISYAKYEWRGKHWAFPTGPIEED